MNSANQQGSNEAHLNRPSDLPKNELEKQLLQLWQKVLQVDQLGVSDNFFEYGGNSFKAVNVVGQIGNNLTLMDIYKNPTIRQLAKCL